jgi:hypothetical protein
MAKVPTTEKPKTLDTLIGIVDLVISHRFPDRTPTLVELARVTSLANNSLRFSDRDEKDATANAATLAVAKRLSVIS